MKKLAILVLTLGMTAAVLTACSNDENDVQTQNNVTATEAPTASATDNNTVTPGADVTEAPAADSTGNGTVIEGGATETDGADKDSDLPGNDESTWGDISTDDQQVIPEIHIENPGVDYGDGSTGEDAADGGHGVALGVDNPDDYLIIADADGNENGQNSGDDGNNGDDLTILDGDDDYYPDSVSHISREEAIAEYEKNRYHFTGKETAVEMVSLYMDAYVKMDPYKMLSCVGYDAEHEEEYMSNFDSVDIFDDMVMSMMQFSYTLGDPVAVEKDEIEDIAFGMMVDPENVSDVYKITADFTISFIDDPEYFSTLQLVNYVGKVNGEYRIIYTEEI